LDLTFLPHLVPWPGMLVAVPPFIAQCLIKHKDRLSLTLL
jgi:hypothetical protein